MRRRDGIRRKLNKFYFKFERRRCTPGVFACHILVHDVWDRSFVLMSSQQRIAHAICLSSCESRVLRACAMCAHQYCLHANSVNGRSAYRTYVFDYYDDMGRRVACTTIHVWGFWCSHLNETMKIHNMAMPTCSLRSAFVCLSNSPPHIKYNFNVIQMHARRKQFSNF